MKDTAKAILAAAAIAVGIMVGAEGTLLVAQLAADHDVDQAPAATAARQPSGPGHLIDPDTGRPFSPDVHDGTHMSKAPIMASTQSVTDNSDRTLQWVLFGAAVFGGLAGLAVIADLLARRRWHQPSLETALASSDPDELPRTAGLLGDRFAQQDRPSAAEHAYRAAIDVDDAYWSPIAQVALADLLTARGERKQAKALLEAAIASGHPRTARVAQARLDQLSSGKATHAAIKHSPDAYETLRDPASSAHRS